MSSAVPASLGASLRVPVPVGTRLTAYGRMGQLVDVITSGGIVELDPDGRLFEGDALLAGGVERLILIEPTVTEVEHARRFQPGRAGFQILRFLWPFGGDDEGEDDEDVSDPPSALPSPHTARSLRTRKRTD